MVDEAMVRRADRLLADLPQNTAITPMMAASLLRDYRGRRIALLSPLVVARKGYYTDLAKWAAGKGFAQLRVDGELLPTKPWPRLERFREHNIELRWLTGAAAAVRWNSARIAVSANEYNITSIASSIQPSGTTIAYWPHCRKCGHFTQSV